MRRQVFDGDDMNSVELRPCANCDEYTTADYCCMQCFLDGEGKTECDNGHIHDEGEDCPECHEAQ